MSGVYCIVSSVETGLPIGMSVTFKTEVAYCNYITMISNRYFKRNIFLPTVRWYAGSVIYIYIYIHTHRIIAQNIRVGGCR